MYLGWLFKAERCRALLHAPCTRSSAHQHSPSQKAPNSLPSGNQEENLSPAIWGLTRLPFFLPLFHAYIQSTSLSLGWPKPFCYRFPHKQHLQISTPKAMHSSTWHNRITPQTSWFLVLTGDLTTNISSTKQQAVSELVHTLGSSDPTPSLKHGQGWIQTRLVRALPMRVWLQLSTCSSLSTHKLQGRTVPALPHPSSWKPQTLDTKHLTRTRLQTLMTSGNSALGFKSGHSSALSSPFAPSTDSSACDCLPCGLCWLRASKKSSKTSKKSSPVLAGAHTEGQRQNPHLW